jgi:hypothetical protein
MVNPRQLKGWISHLPVNDIIGTVRQLHNTIEQFNKLQIDAEKRLKLLEIYHGAFDDILFFYDDLRLRMLPISSSQRKTLAEDIMWLYLDLANGYKIIIKDADEGQCRVKKNSLLLSIYRAMELITRAILYAYHAHQTPPPLAYLEMNQLYLFALKRGLLLTTIKAVKQHVSHPYIDALYKQYLLLSVIDVQSLTGNDIFELYVLIERLADKCEILTDQSSTNLDYAFHINLADDSAPVMISNSSIDSQTDTYRVIDTSKIILAIDSSLAAYTNDTSSSSQSMEMRFYKLLRQQLDAKHRQMMVTLASTKNVKVAVGFDSVSYYLADSERLAEAEEDEVDGIVVAGIGDIKNEHSLSSWSMTDRGDGVQVLTGTPPHNAEMDLRGEVIGIIESANESNRLTMVTGIVQLHERHEGQARLLIEILPGSPLAVICVLEENDDDIQEDYPAMYFPKDKSSKRPATLFTYKEARKSKIMRVIYGNKTVRIKPAALISETLMFVQFSFTAVTAH